MKLEILAITFAVVYAAQPKVEIFDDFTRSIFDMIYSDGNMLLGEAHTIECTACKATSWVL